MFNEYAAAEAGMPQVPCGIAKLRLLAAGSSGPPKGPFARRVSTRRQGVTGMNKRPCVIVGATEPFPLRLTICGEFAAESVNVSVADRTPAALGVKLTEIVQRAFAGSELVQVCP